MRPRFIVGRAALELEAPPCKSMVGLALVDPPETPSVAGVESLENVEAIRLLSLPTFYL